MNDRGYFDGISEATKALETSFTVSKDTKVSFETVPCSSCKSMNIIHLKRQKCSLCLDCEEISSLGSIKKLTPPTQVHPRSLLVYERPYNLKIFLSYGHDCFQELAFALKRGLQERGHSVWVDVEKLAPGCDWENGINGGLTWVKEAHQDGRVLLLMTPHALRRPNGYCLNEITRATANRLSIFPVLVCESDPPPMISMLPFFDMRDCVPATPPLPENSNNHDWLKLMQSHLDSELFQEKANKLYHVLELCDSMNAYGVPAIAGLENLGVFCNDQHDGHPGFIKDLKSTSFRRSLMINTGTSGRSHRSSVSRRINESTATSEMTDPILSSSSLPHISPKSTTDLTRKESLQEIGTPTTDCPPLISPTSTTVTSPIISDDKQQQNAAFKARYFFSFDPTCLVLARRLYQDLSTIGFLVYKPQADQEDRQEAIRWTASEKNGKMILLVTPESVGRPHGVCLNDISAAMSAGLGFVPLMIRQCEIPLSICRIQWLDMTDTLFYTSNHQQEHFSSTRDSCSHPNEGDGISSFPQHKLPSINEARYKLRQEQLVTALKGQLDHEGQQDCLFSLLAPFSFQSEMFSRLTERFTGREWMFKRLEEWLNGPPSQSHRVFWITGQIGAGKTSIAARIVQQFAEVAAVHFAFQEDEQTQHARRCVLSLAYQLTTQLPDYAVFLHSSGRSNEPLEEIVAVSSLSALVNHLLIQPLNAIAPPKSNKPVVLLIDGIERLLFRSKEDVPPSNPPGLEGNQNGSTTNPTECFISMLPNLIANLPYWVRVVILSREDQQTVMKLQNYTPTICLDRFVEENKQDIKKYISKSLSFSTSTSTSSSISMSRSDIHTETTAMLSLERIQTLVSERAEGLFLYAVNIVQQIENGRLQIKDIASLPLGMGGYLRQLFENQCDLTYYKQKIRPILEVLCAAYEPLTLSTLGSILEWTSYEQNEILGSSGTLFYLTEVDQIVKTFHSSVLDWVQDIKNAGPFFVEVAQGHERIGAWAIKEYSAVKEANQRDFINLNVKDFEIGAVIANPKAKAHAYIIRHVLNHLTRSSGADSMQQFALLSRDEQFQQARRLLSLREEGLERFYHGEITREQAQELLMTNPQPGSFLLRYTSHKECYCASFIESIDSSTQVPKFRHFLLHNIGVNQYAIVPKAEITSTTRIYPDLVSIVEEYQLKGRLRAAIPRLTPLNREIFTDTIEAPSQTVPAILTTSGQLPPPLSSPPLSPVPDISTL